jgi:hypothetical protein
MEEREKNYMLWLRFLASVAGLNFPEDTSDISLASFYRHLAFYFYPEKQPVGSDPRHVQRMEHFFKVISNVNDIYTKSSDVLDPPDPNEFHCDTDPLSHDKDTIPRHRGSRTGRRVYLVTFSHPSVIDRRSPGEFSRQEFGDLLLTAFEAAVPHLKVSMSVSFVSKKKCFFYFFN